MLAQTVRSNLKDINNLRMRTKATKFGALFQTVPSMGTDEFEVREVLMKDGLVKVSIDHIEDDPVIEYEDSEIIDYEIVEEDDELYEIVENPDELVVQFPIISDIQLEEKLPFFKSISLKLASL